MAYETLFINGIDVGAMSSCVQAIDGLYITPGQRGDNIVIPGVDGAIYVDKPFDVGTVSLQLLLAGSSTTGFNDAYRQLRTLVAPGKKVQMVRQLSIGSGYEQHVAWGEYVSGLEPQLQLARFGKITLTMRVLSGLWYSTSDYTITDGGAVVVGEARTRRMKIAMPSGTLTNATTNTSVTFSGTGACVIDVEDFSATTGGTDVSQYLTWTGQFPFELVPGINSISGSATIYYRAAYL